MCYKFIIYFTQTLDKKMKSLLALAAVLCTANAQTAIHQLRTCSILDDCKTYLPKQTPDTGISCNTANNQCVCPLATTAVTAPDGTNNYGQCFPLNNAGAVLLANRRANLVYTITSAGTGLNCAEIDNFRNTFRTTFQTLVGTTVTVTSTQHFCSGTTMFTAVFANVLFTDLAILANRNAVLRDSTAIQATLTGILTNLGQVAVVNIYTEEFVRSQCRGTVVGESLIAAPFIPTTLTVCRTILCKPGYSLSTTGVCTSTPAPFMIIRDPNRTPFPTIVFDNDDEMSVGAAAGLTVGIIVFCGIMIGLYVFSSNAEENKTL